MGDPTTAYVSLPSSVGDHAVAAVLLRDLAESLRGRPAGRAGGITPASIMVDEGGRFAWDGVASPVGPAVPVRPGEAELAAPELFTGASTGPVSDVYAAATLALGRYLGHPPVAARVVRRASRVQQIAAIRQAHRHAAVGLGPLPGPLRPAFALALAKEPHLRPAPAALVAMIDTAFDELGDPGATRSRARVVRLVRMAHAFVPATGPVVSGAATTTAAAAATTAATAPTRIHRASHAAPAALAPLGRHRVARGVLIAAVAVVATGGVVVAAAIGIRGGSTPEAISTKVARTPSPTASSSPPSSPVVAFTAAAPAAPAADGAGANGGGSGDSGGSAGSGGSYSGGYDGGTGRYGGGSSSHSTPTHPTYRPPSTTPATGTTPAPTTPAGSTTPPSSDPPSSDPPSSDPPTSDPPSSDPPSSDPPSSDPPSSDPPSSDPPSSDPASSDPPSSESSTPSDPAPAPTA